jgi:hypothetical protein
MSYEIIDDGVLDLTGMDMADRPPTWLNENTPMSAGANYTMRTHMPLDMRGNMNEIYDAYQNNYESMGYMNRKEATKSTSRPDMNDYLPRIQRKPLPRDSTPVVDCKTVLNHVEGCDICKSYFYHDKKFLYFVIFILVCIILYLLKKDKRIIHQ